MSNPDELGEWADLPPDALLRNPGLLAGQIAVTEPWKAIAYARRTPNPSYDELAYRIAAATPCGGAVPLQTIAQTLVERERDRDAARIRRLRRDHDDLLPRALDLPISDGSLRYELTDTRMKFSLRRQSSHGVFFDESWILGRSHPPQMLLRNAVSRDAMETFNQHCSVELPHMAWVQLETLIKVGRMLPRQQWEDGLLKRVELGRLYLFVSHRWRSPEHPDPDGREASLLAWQLIDHLCEAVMIATRRGLHTPRKYEPNFGQFIGLSGRELAEIMIVNVLRPNLSDSEIVDAAEEASEIEAHLAEDMFKVAGTDIGLGLLRRLLERAPYFRRLTDRICLWYDFASLPQAPRSADEETVFQVGLRSLGPIQLMGNTVVLIDLPERYLSRAWCTLEAIGANSTNQELVLLHAEARSTAIDSEIESYFMSMMTDRPYVVRRAILDTFLFGVQTPQVCFERLGINLTESADLVNVFDMLRGMSHTLGAHIDNSSVVTGCLPLAPVGESYVVMPVRSARIEHLGDKDGDPGSLDWTSALLLAQGEARRLVPAHVTLSGNREGIRAHVIVLAGCEGDAILIASWTSDHLAELESEIEASAVAISWLSDDIAPVGHMSWGKLEPIVVQADVWVIVAPRAVLDHGPLAKRLLAAAAAAGLRRVVIAVDDSARNVHRLPVSSKDEAKELVDSQAIESLDLRPIVGGIFSAALQDTDVLLFQHPRSSSVAIDAYPAPTQLQVMLINSVLENESEMLNRLCQSFPRSIEERFKSWMKVPEELQQPPLARAYVNALVQITAIMKALGFDGPHKTMFSANDNPIARWHRMIASADAATQKGDYHASTCELNAVLEEMKSVTGSAIGDLRPKVLGKVSLNHFHDGRLDEAKQATRAALEACREVADEEGVAVYSNNLQLLESAETQADSTVAQIARAQQLSDHGRYEASNKILHALVLEASIVHSCKAYGLLGSNYHWLGDGSAAARYTREAASFAQRIGDPDALRVYSYNLTRINEVSRGQQKEGP